MLRPFSVGADANPSVSHDVLVWIRPRSFLRSFDIQGLHQSFPAGEECKYQRDHIELLLGTSKGPH
jgi:hypothetical protein